MACSGCVRASLEDLHLRIAYLVYSVGTDAIILQ